jgi:hypothetical protein
MNDPEPHNRNRLGRIISLLTHPLVVFIPTLVIVLKNTEPLQAVAWLVLISVIILVPAVVVLGYFKRNERYTYQRETRHLIYAIFWLGMAFCIVLGIVADAPPRLVFSLLALCVWTPLQAFVNARFTKISVHVAVITGIATALVVMGDLNTLKLIGGACLVVAATAWARIVTGNHTRVQIALGILVSAISVVLAYGLMSLWRPL